MVSNNTSSILSTQSWFIPIDILLIVCTISVVILALIFLIIIIFDKTCHTIPMMLIANSCLAELFFGSDMLAMAIFAFHNDLKQIQYEDSLCIFRGYLGYVVTFLQNYSYLLQAIYRYILVVYPTRLFWQSARCQASFICSAWIVGFLLPILLIFTGPITYNIDNQICQIPSQFSLTMVFTAFIFYIIPISLIVLIYFKFVKYVKEMSARAMPLNTLARAQRELQMIRRIVILVIGVATLGFPYTLFVCISFFTRPPQYHFRIAYIFVDASLVFVMIILFKFTEPLQTSLMKKINGRTNRVA